MQYLWELHAVTQLTMRSRVLLSGGPFIGWPGKVELNGLLSRKMISPREQDTSHIEIID